MPSKQPLRPVPSTPDEVIELDARRPWEDVSITHTKTKEADTVPVGTRVSRDFQRKMAMYVGDPNFPEFQTMSDVLRDSIWRWLRIMAQATRNEDQAAALDLQKQQWRLEAAKATRERMLSIVETARTLLEEDSGERTRRKTLSELSALMPKLDEDTDIRRKVASLIAKYDD